MVGQLAGKSGLAALRVASLLVGAVIGAGFASGREIVTFFDPLGSLATVALAVAVGVLAIGGHAVVRVAVRRGALTYASVFTATAGRRAGPAIDALVTAFLFLTVGVTLAGGAALVSGQYHVPGPLALGLVAGAACGLTYRGARALLRAGPALVPPLLLALLTIAGCTLFGGLPAPHVAEVSSGGQSAASLTSYAPSGTAAALASGLLYGAYNLILAVGVLVAGTRYESATGTATGSLAGGVALGGIALAVLAACRRAGPRAINAAIPVAELATCLGKAGAHLYALTLLLAVITTLTAAAMSVGERISSAGPLEGRTGLAALLVIALAVIPAAAGFATLVRLVYPPMGLVGLVWLAILLARA